MVAGNRTPAPPSAYPDAQRQVARELSALVAGDVAESSPRFVVVSWVLTRLNSYSPPVSV